MPALAGSIAMADVAAETAVFADIDAKAIRRPFTRPFAGCESQRPKESMPGRNRRRRALRVVANVALLKRLPRLGLARAGRRSLATLSRQ